MAATVQAAITPTPELVGNAFVHQYYLILHKSPNMVHRFYQPISKLGRPEKDGAMSTTTGTLDAIDKKILSLGYGDYTAEITSVDAQESHSGGVLVLVTGFLIAIDNSRQKFTQSFFLAPQDKGYFVLNDVFRYVDDSERESRDINCGNNSEPPIVPNQDSHTQEDHISLHSEEANGEEPYDPSELEDDLVEEIVPVANGSDVATTDPEIANELCSKMEEVGKKSYASILKVMKDNAASTSPVITPSKSVAKSPEEVVRAVIPASQSDADVAVVSSNSSESLSPQENEAEGPSIFIKGLPLDATRALIENEFRRFGPIRANGVQVKLQRGFCYGFVEFEGANAFQNALDASPVVINGYRVIVEEKRSTSRGNNRGRFLAGNSSVYGNGSTRGRGYYGGAKVFNRTDFRSEFGNRGGGRTGYSNRGNGDGYRRGDRMGNNGSGRANRGNVLPINGAARNMTPSVSATA